MTLNYQDLINQEAEALAATQDMNEASAGGGFPVIESGEYLGAVVAYIDLGNHEDEYNGKVSGVFPRFKMDVAVFQPDENGTLNPDPVVVRDYGMFVKRNERSKAFKAFRALNYTNDPNFTHFAQAFMRPYIFKVDKKTAKSGRDFNAIDWEKTRPAVDPMTKQPYQLPEIDDALKIVFLWNNPVREMWDKLYIDGENDNGESKNFIQEEIVNAKNFPGSAVDLMLQGSGAALPTPEQAPDEPQSAPKQAAQPAPVPAPQPTAPAYPMPTPPQPANFGAPATA